MMDVLREYLGNKKILVLGFGKEGQSTYGLLRKLFPEKTLCIADRNEDLKENEIIRADRSKVLLHLGDNYLESIPDYDLIIKSPGISLKNFSDCDFSKFTSHTELFIRLFRKQIIGITGTKGKSTTASLVHHIISNYTNNCVLVGNIGVPPFDMLDRIDRNTIIVYELSSHQLEQVSVSPHISVLLNLYEEHLDHYHSFENYQLAKLRIALYQDDNDFFIYNGDDIRITNLLSKNTLQGRLMKFSLFQRQHQGCFLKNRKVFYKDSTEIEVLNKTEFKNLIGEHNLQNIMAAICASILSGVPTGLIGSAVESFIPLEHRIEFVGKYNEVLFYNDSISTIPEATMAAVKSLMDVDTLILGGFDRGISYERLIDFLNDSTVQHLIFIGGAGRRMYIIYQSRGRDKKDTFVTSDFEEAVAYAKRHTQKNKICLLSPAAASYDMFKDFAERGKKYKQLLSK
ncbi:MAG TPA: UDP-N-acetylmuramoyl-L-alanine--D-glutamate ligase [Bacteroidales bacterium]|jgi:UDP-N-acetylmuramoylalanine--D-glutamate ligase|nr:UDP-N-acetylmuramoyl-L-alanine--D-glutamate ligase [Paludibacteraceae bacterium]HPI29992.1 UDP-N-acetylmuramoyl-L-alanine--D-glutamate ligase [Bacteroidales bacterium]HQN16511.1 UDP-N-acetylmuramoyl-L-alanine--D-glutamate ligase [Bacteroidales bacterium]HQP16175.1 UDP-N-acetylmuramoyl-L-alanine--D-glutamate ligase [Bacteroidales bacterium]